VAEPVPSRVALVTGAGSGIGRALAVGLAEHGLDVGLLGRHAQPLEQTARQCRDAGAEVAVVVADVTDASVTVAVAEVAERLGPIDLLVNNAGRIDATEVPFVAADLDDVLGVVEVTLLGVLRVTHAVLGRMVEQGRGRILTVNSGFADARSPAYTGYAVAKAAAARLTDLVAAQSGGDGIVTLDASPGLVRTAMTEGMPMWQRRDAAPFGDPAAIVAVACAFADGDLDVLSGRFVHATKDEVVDLAARGGEIVASDARRLRLAGYGSDDPLTR
jgi:3-oxoacyl-[acyl-carrier protein] reductase